MSTRESVLCPPTPERPRSLPTGPAHSEQESRCPLPSPRHPCPRGLLQSSLRERETEDKVGSPRAGQLASRLPIPTSEVGTARTHTLGVTGRPRGLPCRSGRRQEAQASFLLIIRCLSCSRGPAQEGFWFRVPEIHTMPAPPPPSLPRTLGAAVRVVPVLGAGVTWAQACGTRQASVSLGGTLAW